MCPEISLQYKKSPLLDFVLKPGKTLVGHVVDEQGKPLKDVGLHLQTWEAVEYSGLFGRYAVTDTNGAFRMEHLPEGKITLRLDKEGYLYMNNQPAEVEHDKPITTMKTSIVMQKGARTYAKVVNAETGKPIRRFRAKAAFPKQLVSGDIPPNGLPSDWTKGFAFQSDTGEFKTFERFRRMVIALQVEVEGYAPNYIPRVVFGAYDKEPLIIRMKKQTPIEGIVVDAETGKPLADALITTFDENHFLQILGSAPEYRATEPARTDAQGKFALPGALAEVFYLYITHPERAAAIAGPLNAPTDEKSQSICVEMQKGCAITGTTHPGQQIQIELSDHNPHLKVELRTRASHEGIYRFENLTPGRYYVQEMIQGGSGRSTGIELQPGETKTLNFHRTGSTRLYGQVAEADGTPIKNVVVDARGIPKGAKKPWSEEILFEYSGAATSDAEGRYEIVGLPSGDYQLNARLATFPPKPGEMEAARRAGKFPERPRPRETTSAFTIAEEDKEVEVNIIFPRE